MGPGALGGPFQRVYLIPYILNYFQNKIPKKLIKNWSKAKKNQKCKKKGTAKNGGARAKRAPPHFCFVHFRVHF